MVEAAASVERPGKRLVCCFDGTWNTPKRESRATNVVRILRAVAPFGEDGVPQIKFYDKGVGTGDLLDRIRGGAFGRGLDDNVQDGYRFLGNNWEPGDEIYLFGFSRGAFTARSLGGLIGACGLLGRDDLGEVDRAWRLYKTPPDRRDPKEVAYFHQAGRRGRVRIRCIGVWDTVGALGIPIGFLQWRNRKHQFHDTELGPIVDVGLHAVAIDEKRGPFEPTLWVEDDVPEDERKQSVAGQTVEQVWFPGVHSNVGGGYPDRGLSDIALGWMIGRVQEHTDLAFRGRYVEDLHPDPLATLYDSRTWLYTFSRFYPFRRVIGNARGWLGESTWRASVLPEGKRVRGEAVHASALARFGRKGLYRPPQKSLDPFPALYAPDNLAAAKEAGVPVVE